MFGYVIVNRQELRLREYERYRSYYCGLCGELRKSYGSTARFCLSYDMTFVIMLLTALYEPESTDGMERCFAHPFTKHPVRENCFTVYAADMNLLLACNKCEDDWKDERKFAKKIYSMLLGKRVRRISEKYPEKVRAIDENLLEIGKYEDTKEPNIDLAAGAFGEIMAEVLAVYRDEWENELRRIGFYLGKFVYILDAFDDLETDKKSGSYNPLLLRCEADEGFRTGLKEEVEAMLLMMMSECSRAFERLPIIDRDVEILRNILYSGVWSRFGDGQGKKKK
ncbi:MAG: DUF5685 family protein [Lachnospiraceae bacterium]|nr:DUF5685 family protein [Lachnospiraceae bacterium]